MSNNIESATFGAGCFWGVENNFMQLEGVIETSVGYMGGSFKNPTYFDVCTGMTGHAEVVDIKFDNSKISFEQLCNFFFSIHDPTTLNKQGPDVGTQYRSEIFYNNDEQKNVSLSMIKKLNNKYNSKITTKVSEIKNYTKAEDYHQKYLEKNRF